MLAAAFITTHCLTWPLLLYQGLQGFTVGRPMEATQRLLPSTGTMPSTSPLKTQILSPAGQLFVSQSIRIRMYYIVHMYTYV
jgi:hypothetical protein